MKKLQSISIYPLLIAVLAVGFFVSSCDNPAGGSEEDHDHTEPFGLELVYDNDVIIEYSDGIVTEHQHMHLNAGETYLFEVHFSAEDGDHIHAEDLDEDYFLGWIIENETVLQIQQNEENGPWAFQMEALAEGETRIQLRLMHGTPGSAHSDFETPAVTSENAIELHVGAEDHTE